MIAKTPCPSINHHHCHLFSPENEPGFDNFEKGNSNQRWAKQVGMQSTRFRIQCPFQNFVGMIYHAAMMQVAQSERKTMMRISDIFKMLLKQRSSFLERQSSDTATRSRPKLSTYGMVMRFGVFSERDMLSIYVNETDCKMDCLSMLDYESVVFAFR
jgi:hypothetical protein